MDGSAPDFPRCPELYPERSHVQISWFTCHIGFVCERPTMARGSVSLNRRGPATRAGGGVPLGDQGRGRTFKTARRFGRDRAGAS